MKLTIDSICLISAMLSKMQIDEKFINEMVELGKKGKGKSKNELSKLQEQIGIRIVLKITSKLHLVKDELIEFIAKYKGVSEEEAKKLDMIEVVKEIVKDKEITDFFKLKLASK